VSKKPVPKAQKWPTVPPSDGVLLFGDDGWFAVPEQVAELQTSIEWNAEAQPGITVGSPEDEVNRMFPGPEVPLVASTAVLRLGGTPGARLAFGEDDVATAYRKLSRAVHPDKTRGIPNSDEAFKRLKDAGDELREDFKATREVVRRMEGLLGDSPREEGLKRPQIVLFAAALRFLMSVIGLTGEGRLEEMQKQRAANAFQQVSSTKELETSAVIEAWSKSSELLDMIGTQAMRHSYECVPKHYRAQFICALSRAAWFEEEPGEIFRPQWRDVLALFPEIQKWRLLEMQIRERTWADKTNKRRSRRSSSSSSGSSRSRSRRRSREREKPSAESLSAVAALAAVIAAEPIHTMPRSMGAKAAASASAAAATVVVPPSDSPEAASVGGPGDQSTFAAPASAEAARAEPLGSACAATAAPSQKSGWGDAEESSLKSRKSRWMGEDEEENATKKEEMAKMYAEMVADSTAKAKREARANAKAKGGGKRMENELGSRWEITSWAQNWRHRLMAVLPHGDDCGMHFSARPLRLLLLELWEQVTQGASGDAKAALTLFGAEQAAAQTDGVAARWAFVPAADLLLTVGEGIVGVTFEGAYILDPRKQRAGGVWANVNLLPGTKVDPDVKRFVDDFGLEDPQVVGSLVRHVSFRPATKRRDLDDLRDALRGVRDPAGVLSKKLREMAEQVGAVTTGGKGRASGVPAGKGVPTAGGAIKIGGVTFAPGAFTKGAKGGQLAAMGGGGQQRSQARVFH